MIPKTVMASTRTACQWLLLGEVTHTFFISLMHFLYTLLFRYVLLYSLLPLFPLIHYSFFPSLLLYVIYSFFISLSFFGCSPFLLVSLSLSSCLLLPYLLLFIPVVAYLLLLSILSSPAFSFLASLLS
jgi:hypothetical protein